MSMEDSDGSVAISGLICHEDVAELNAAVADGGERCQAFQLFGDSVLLDCEADDEYVETLVARERSSGQRPSLMSESWFVDARCTAVEWILKKRGFFGFGFRTSYLAVSYFDRFFVRRSIDNGKLWAIRLLSLACLTLAAKMEECRVPALSEFDMEDYNFDSDTIQRMELLVLDTMGWQMNITTPFEYLGYFMSKLQCRNRSKDSIFSAIGVIITSIHVISSVNYRPSVIAAAAILSASDERLTKEELIVSKMSTIALFGSLEREDVFSCYTLMTNQESPEKLMPATKSSATSYLSATYTAAGDSIDVLDNPYFTISRDKRRRLEFKDIN